jgi:hypothetical protein
MASQSTFRGVFFHRFHFVAFARGSTIFVLDTEASGQLGGSMYWYLGWTASNSTKDLDSRHFKASRDYT